MRRTTALFTDEQLQELRRRYEEGASTELLATEHGTYATTICRNIRKAGGTLRSNVKLKFNDEVANEMRKKYEAGATLQDLVDEYGTYRTTISHTLKRVGTTLRPTGYEKGTRKLGPRKPAKGLLGWLNS